MTRRKRTRSTAADASAAAPRTAGEQRDRRQREQRRRPEWVSAPVVLIVVLAIVAYANALPNGFVLDDVPIIVENPVIRDVGNLGTMFGSNYWSRGGAGLVGDSTLYRPLTLFSYSVDHALWGIDSTAFHAMNVALHAVTCVLVYVLAMRLFASALISFAVASIFAVHPIHTEAVTGIVGRAEILATLFVLAAFLLLRRQGVSDPSQRASSGAGWIRIVGGAALYLLGLFAKESAVTLPAILAADDWLRRRDVARQHGPRTGTGVARYGSLAVALGIYLVFRSQAVTGGAQMWPGFLGVPAFDRILTASRVLLEYVWMFVFPKTLLAHYWKRDVPIATSIAEPLVLLSVVVWIAIGVAAVRWRDREPVLVFAIAWFFVTIAPVSNIAFPIGVGKAERILYLPSVGLTLVVGWALQRVQSRLRSPVVLQAVLACVLVALAARTYVRNKDWRDNLTLATAALSVSPRSPLMNDLAAGELFRRGDPRRATELLRIAVREAPDMALLQNHLGAAYHSQGLLDEAIVAFREAIRTTPTDASAYNNLGVAYRDKGMDADALAQFQAAIRINPNYADPHINIGSAHMQAGRFREAEAEFAAAVRADPLSASAHNALGAAYTALAQPDRAAEHFREALRLDPANVSARANLERVAR